MRLYAAASNSFRFNHVSRLLRSNGMTTTPTITKPRPKSLVYRNKNSPIYHVTINPPHRRTFVWHAGYENIKDANEIRQQIHRLFLQLQQKDESNNNNTTTTTKEYIQKQLDALYQRYETITGEEYSPEDNN